MESGLSDRGATQPAATASPKDVGAIIRTLMLIGLAPMMVADLAMIFLWVPTEQIMGVVQRIFYFHVPLAWVSLLSFSVVFLASVMYLWKGQRKWDALGHSAAEIGVLFATLFLFTGSVWAKPIWGVWWTWDPRLTTSLILWLMYVAYLMLRSYAPTPSQAARYSAVMGIVGFTDVPIVYFSSVWWRNIHPSMVVGPAAESGSLDPTMRTALMYSILTFTVMFGYLLWERIVLRNAEDSVNDMRYAARTL